MRRRQRGARHRREGVKDPTEIGVRGRDVLIAIHIFRKTLEVVRAEASADTNRHEAVDETLEPNDFSDSIHRVRAVSSWRRVPICEEECDRGNVSPSWTRRAENRIRRRFHRPPRACHAAVVVGSLYAVLDRCRGFVLVQVEVDPRGGRERDHGNMSVARTIAHLEARGDVLCVEEGRRRMRT
jgi:hypothetical protein